MLLAGITQLIVIDSRPAGFLHRMLELDPEPQPLQLAA